ncbi:MAG TPA: Flp family type IVb pilin [Terriglobales bacterium]|jgi:pilus assembly protein Flp/PilA|nr:Flp family type IVb pilin [Terriglobales bacterium]
MKRFALNALTRLHKNESGQGLAEYLLVLALVALAATAGMSTLADNINNYFSAVGSELGHYVSPNGT